MITLGDLRIDQHDAARFLDQHRCPAGGIEVGELVALKPGRLADQLMGDALLGQHQPDLARKGTEGELVELPHGRPS
jgi:hypothetical protein